MEQGERDQVTAFEQYSLPAAALMVGVTGIWLTLAGRPYGVALQTVHKLVALAGAILFGMLVYRRAQLDPLGPRALGLLVVSALLAIAGFASGGVVSAMSDAPVWVLWLHRVGSWLSLASAAVLAWYVSWVVLVTR